MADSTGPRGKRKASPAHERYDHCHIGNCRRPPGIKLNWEAALCHFHADLIWHTVEWRDTDRYDETVEGAEGRAYTRVEARAKRSEVQRKPAAMGEIYYVRVGGLIKVGWTTKLADRVRSYGPDAVLLANYPGTRADEGALHRQLKPARYKGREWYTDGGVTDLFIKRALKEHGPPRFTTVGWTEHEQVVAGKHATRGRR